jgi:hypothetical protein
LFAPVCALVLSHISVAQSLADGALAGRLLTSSGTPASYTQVLAVELESGLVQKTTTNRDGEFTVPRLPPGEYSLAVADSVVAIPLPEVYEVHIGEVTTVSPRMSGGPQAAAEPAVSSGDTTALPVQGGDWHTLALLTPTVNSAILSSGDAADLSTGGLSSTQNATRTDGVSADNSFSGASTGSGSTEDPEAGADDVADPSAGPGAGSRSLLEGAGRRTGSSYSFAQSAIREFRVRAQSDAVEYGSALYGHGAGGIVTSASRSGGTRLHGMLSYDVRDSAWAASNPFAIASSYSNGIVTSTPVKPRDLQQHIAARISGPLMTQYSDNGTSAVASRLSYIYAFERQLRDYPAISSPASPDFFNLTAMQTALLANRGVSAGATRTALTYLNSLTGPVPRRADQSLNFARIDWLRTAGARAIFEYNRVRWSNPGGTRSSAVVNRGTASLGSSYGSVDAFVARLLLFPKPHLTNELRLQYSHELQYEVAQQPLPQEPAIGPGGFAPEVSIGPDGFAFGTPATLGRNAYPDERRLEAADVLAWIRGRHMLQFGGDFSALRDFTNSLSNVEGTFTYDSSNTNGHAGGVVDWITDYTFGVNSYPNGGCPSINAPRHNFCFRSFSQSFGQQSLTWHTQQWAGFLQDDWRASTLLTLHLGVRYEYELLPIPQQPNARLDALFGSAAATGIFPEDRNNFGPRVGIAWQPLGQGHGTVRIGYGLYFGKLPGATIRAALLDTVLPSSTTRIRITPTTETPCPQQPQVGFGYPCSFLASPSGVVAQSTSVMMFSRRFRMPAVQQGTFSIEHPVGWGVLGSASFVVNLDRQLPSSVDLNIEPATGVAGFQLEGGTGLPGARDREIFYLPIYNQRVTSSFGPVTAIMSNANATYNAVTLEAQRGLGGRTGLGGTGRGLEFRVAWTWSKALDFAPNSGAIPRSNSQFDPFDNRYDKGPSALNFPHHIVATAVWSPHVTDSARPVRTLLGGWALAGIFNETNGRGYSYMIFGGSRLPGGHESINGSGGSTVLPTSGRNTLRLSDTSNLDLRLTRTFRIGETLRAHASADAFNVANRVNYSGVTQRAYLVGTPGSAGSATGITPLIFQDAATIAAEGLNTLPFGAFTDAGAGPARERKIQLGLRFEF